MYGEYDQSEGLGRVDDRGLTPLAALEEAILPALQRPPCLVSFSGGRDSSGVLAAAVRAARRDRLAPPVPVTLRVSNAPMAEASVWRHQPVRGGDGTAGASDSATCRGCAPRRHASLRGWRPPHMLSGLAPGGDGSTGSCVGARCAPRDGAFRCSRQTGVLLSHPLVDPTFLAAVARRGGHLGFGDRTGVMRAIFDGALPDAVLRRPTKARYGEAFWGQRTREFARRWGGTGVDGELVDPVALRTEWLKPNPHEDSAMLLHAAWLSEQSEGV